MDILTDSNIFIDLFKTNDAGIRSVFETENIVICGVIKAELLHGAVSSRDFNRIEEMIKIFDSVDIEAEDWGKLGRLLYCFRTNGLSLPFQDAIIAYLALKYQLTVWTKDPHFTHIQRIVPELSLYHSESDTCD